MCGIVGGISYKNVLPSLIEGLERLEYRGYDSVGIALNNLNIDIELQNPYNFYTKGEMVENCLNNVFLDKTLNSST